MSNHAKLLPIAEKAVALATDIVRCRLPGTVSTKGDRDMVTEVDYAVEHTVREYLRQETPDIALLGEEEGCLDTTPTSMLWTLDPIDGTANFTHGIPLVAVSLALLQNQKPVIGVVSLPLLSQKYHAIADQGAFCDDQAMNVSNTNSVSDAMISIGDYAVGTNSLQKNRERIALTKKLAEKAQRVRMIGAAAIDLAWVAEGKLDASIILSNKPWDTSAGVLIAREAGAIVVDRDGSSHTFDSTATIAVTPKIYNELSAEIAEIINTTKLQKTNDGKSAQQQQEAQG